ncbi:MAG: ATP-binding protein [Bacteroidales bacterium]
MIKKYIILLLFILSGYNTMFSKNMSYEKKDSPIILVINSFSSQNKWFALIETDIVNKLKKELPNATIATGNLNCDKSLFEKAIDMHIRSAVWSIAKPKELEPYIAHAKTKDIIFITETIPDILVLIGDEANFYYKNYSKYIDKWKNIPTVLVACSEYIQYPYPNFNCGFNFSKCSKIYDIKDEFNNQTGVIVNIPVKENIDLILQSSNKIKEIIWIDDEYYSSLYFGELLKRIIEKEYKGIRFRSIIHDRRNTDSIINSLAVNSAGKAYITYNWNVIDIYSTYSDTYIDSLLSKSNIPPLFTLIPRNFSDNYYIGGYYISEEKCAKAAVELILATYNSTSAIQNMPKYRYVNDIDLILNMTAIKRYKLKSLQNIEKAIYNNIPPGFIKKYEKELIIALSIIIIIIVALILFYTQYKQTKKLKRGTGEIEFLLNKLQLIYEKTSINFALYSESGERKLLIINGKKCNNDSEFGGILSNNLFENPILTEELACKLKNDKNINCEIDTSISRYINLNLGKDAVYHVIIKEIANNNDNYKYISIVLDITSNIANIEEKKKFDRLIEFATKRSMVGIAYYNITTQIGTATDSWYTNLCEKPNNTIAPLYTSFNSAVKDSIPQYLASLKNGSRDPFTMDFEIITPNGIRWIREHIFIHHINDDSSIDVIDINMDVTDLKESENILIVLNEQVMEAKKESDKFLNSISHEIRTPLNSIVGFSGIYVNTDELEEKKKFEEIIKLNITQLIELVNNIVHIAQLDSHSIKTKSESIPINETITRLKEETDLFYKQDKVAFGKNVSIECNLPSSENYITIDKKMFTQIFINLLSNALKFTEKGRITIGYYIDNNIYNFYVKDTGIGIAKNNLDLLFERFEKIDTFTQGTGLGLPLCKSILNTLGGNIYVKSELGKGSEFRFTLKNS